MGHGPKGALQPSLPRPDFGERCPGRLGRAGRGPRALSLGPHPDGTCGPPSPAPPRGCSPVCGWLTSRRVSSPGDPRHSCVHSCQSFGDSQGSPAGAVVWSRTGVWGPRRVRGCPVLLFALPGVPGSRRCGLASPSGSAPRRTQGAGSVSNSGGLACGPRVRIHLGSKPQGETLHIPFDQRPLSEDGPGWAGGGQQEPSRERWKVGG